MNRAARRVRLAPDAGPRIWRGRRGPVVLGPTEDRVARYLEAATQYGLVTLRTVELAARLGLERSEAYRITRQLRVLGLFGIANDRGGTAGGRRYWRTAIEHDGAELERSRHRTAWARVVAACRATARTIAATISAASWPVPTSAAIPGGAPGGIAGPHPAIGAPPGSFRELMRAAGIGGWIER